MCTCRRGAISAPARRARLFPLDGDLDVPDLLNLFSRRWRMTDWLLVALGLALLVWLMAPQQLPVSVYKLSLVAMAAVAGYWIDRSLFPYARPAYLLDLQDSLMAGSPELLCDDDDQCALMDSARDDLLLRLCGTSMLRRAIIVGCAMLAMGLGA